MAESNSVAPVLFPGTATCHRDGQPPEANTIHHLCFPTRSGSKSISISQPGSTALGAAVELQPESTTDRLTVGATASVFPNHKQPELGEGFFNLVWFSNQDILKVHCSLKWKHLIFEQTIGSTGPEKTQNRGRRSGYAKIRSREVAEFRNVQGVLAWELTPVGQALSFQGVSRGNHPSILGHTGSRTNPLPQNSLCLKFLLAL